MIGRARTIQPRLQVDLTGTRPVPVPVQLPVIVSVPLSVPLPAFMKRTRDREKEREEGKMRPRKEDHPLFCMSAQCPCVILALKCAEIEV